MGGYLISGRVLVIIIFLDHSEWSEVRAYAETKSELKSIPTALSLSRNLNICFCGIIGHRIAIILFLRIILLTDWMVIRPNPSLL